MLLGIALGTLLLFVFYRAVQSEWPETYFGATDVSAYAISASPLRYLAFRLVPVYIVCVLVAVSLDRRGQPGALGAVIVATAHAGPTLGVALFTWVRSGSRHRRDRASIALLRAVTMVGVIAAGVFAGQTRGVLEPFVPALRELSAAVWTALFAGIAAAFVVRVSRGALNTYELARHSSRMLSPRLLRTALDAAREAGADPTLVVAVMIVESIQRPSWFRALERLKSRIVRRGTYGIMQIDSGVALSDEESIHRAVAERLAGISVRGPKGIDIEALRAFAAKYNPDRKFADLLVSAYAAAQELLKPQATST